MAGYEKAPGAGCGVKTGSGSATNCQIVGVTSSRRWDENSAIGRPKCDHSEGKDNYKQAVETVREIVFMSLDAELGRGGWHGIDSDGEPY